MKSYVFPIELAEEEDGRWSAWIEILPGCAAWGYTKEEALQAIHDAAQAYVEDMLAAGEALPTDRRTRGGSRVYCHPNGRRTVIHYHRASDTLPIGTLRSVLTGSRVDRG